MRIYTLGELSRAPESTLAAIFGVNGERMRQRALGLEISEVTSLDEEREVKSVSNERTFAKDLTERGDIEAAIALLGESVGRRLRRQGLTGATVTLKLKYSYGAGVRHSAGCLIRPTMRTSSWRLPLELFDNIWQDGMHVRLAGIGMSDFDHQGGIQTDLFCEIDDRGAPIQRPPRPLRRHRRRPRQIRRHRPFLRPPIPLQRLTAFGQKESRAAANDYSRTGIF